MKTPVSLLAPETLSSALERATQHALACGALQPIETKRVIVEDEGIPFLIRRVSSLTRKEIGRATDGQKTSNQVNPFLPFDQNLFVAEISDTHIALLNRFNVTAHHMLLVTRRFVPQEQLLDCDDFAALAACLAQLDVLGFYNSGAAAGASQPHKHLQMVPLPLGTDGYPTPIEVLFAGVQGCQGIVAVPGLSFRHAFTWLDPTLVECQLTAAPELQSRYLSLLERIGVAPVVRNSEHHASAAYNLLMTRRWMLAVARLNERYETIAINALGFAGSFFLRDDAQFMTVQRIGPMAVLRAVAGTRDASQTGGG